jgi:aminopeptidase
VDRLEPLADLLVAAGANVQPGQIVAVSAQIGGHEELARAVAAQAYKRGARFVDVTWFDPHVKRARIAHADEDTLGFVPSWLGERVTELGAQRCARIALTGPTAPGLLDDLDPVRAGRDQLPFLRELLPVINARTTNWTVGPCPTAAWAQLAHPGIGPQEALERLWSQIEHVCRLDEPDPIAAWKERSAALAGVARRLSERRFDALRFEGPGTDLTVGLFRSSRFAGAESETVAGIIHLANLPSEEVYTTPDPERVDGVVRSTKPLVLNDGSIVRDLVVRFERGRAVSIEAAAGAELLRGRASMDAGASRLGEVALVDREGRIGPLNTVFYDTLLDENAASHIALGSGFEPEVEDAAERARVNESAIHIDFMIGGDNVEVTGLTAEGERVPVLRGGAWQV